MPNERPSILVINTHDSGRHFGCYGVPSVHTPAIDALAADGVRFSNMFATSSICSPSRGSLLTGKDPQSNGLLGLAGGSWHWELTDPRQHLSHILHDAGYHTVLAGSQHETADVTTLGFDEHVVPVYLGKDRRRGPDAVEVATGAAKFFAGRTAGDPPFYAQVGFFETHTPWDYAGCQPDREHGVCVPPDSGRPNDDAELQDWLAGFQGSVRRVDKAVALLLDSLRENGIEENTLVLFTTDHGVERPRAKWTMWDGGIGIAFIMRWPVAGIVGGQTCDWLLSNIDFLPTLGELAGVPLPDDVEGGSFAGAFDERAAGASPRDEIHALFVNAEMYAVRTERWKYIRNFREGAVEPATGKAIVAAELYDLTGDPHEFENVVDDPAHAEARHEMEDRFWRWLEDVHAPILHGPVPTPTWRARIADYHRWQQAR